jgi:TonB family protein
MSLRRIGLCALLTLPLGCGAAPPPSGATPAGALGEPGGGLQQAPPATAPSPGAELTTQKKPDAEGESGGSTVGGAEVVNEPLGGGTLTQQEIRAVVLKHAELFDKCYVIGAGKSRDFVATVTVKATVAKSGTVTVSEVVKSTSKNKQVDTCVADAFKQIKFPPPKGAATSVITFPIEFQATEEVRAQ